MTKDIFLLCALVILILLYPIAKNNFKEYRYSLLFNIGFYAFIASVLSVLVLSIVEHKF